MRISILTWENFNGRRHGSIGSSMWRGEWLADAWDEATLWKTGDYSDAMIFQKCYWKSFWEDYKGIKILDICDPDWMRIEEGEQVLLLKQAEQYVDAITCSSQGLYDILKVYIKKPVVFIPDRVNLKFTVNNKRHESIAKTVVWFGYYHNQQLTLPAILSTLKKHNLSLLVISNSPFQPATTYGVEIRNAEWNWHNAFQWIQEGDIAINPQPPLGLMRYKSSNKTILAQALGLPVAKDGADIERFLDPNQRTEQCAKDAEDIKRSWDIKFSVEQYKQLLCEIQNARNS